VIWELTEDYVTLKIYEKLFAKNQPLKINKYRNNRFLKAKPTLKHTPTDIII